MDNTISLPLWHDDLALIDSELALSVATSLQNLDRFSEKISQIGAEFSDPNRYQEQISAVETPNLEPKKKVWFSSLRRKKKEPEVKEKPKTIDSMVKAHEVIKRRAFWEAQANQNIKELNEMVETFHEVPSLINRGLRDCRKLMSQFESVFKKEQESLAQISLSDTRTHRSQRQKIQGLERAKTALGGVYDRFTNAQSSISPNLGLMLDEWLDIEKDNLIRIQFTQKAPQDAGKIAKMTVNDLNEKHFEIVYKMTGKFVNSISQDTWKEFDALDPSPQEMAALPLHHVANILFEYCSTVINHNLRPLPEEKMEMLFSDFQEEKWKTLRQYQQSNFLRPLSVLVEVWIEYFSELAKNKENPLKDVGFFATLIEHFPAHNPYHQIDKWMEGFQNWSSQHPPFSLDRVLLALSQTTDRQDLNISSSHTLAPPLRDPILQFVLDHPECSINAVLINGLVNSFEDNIEEATRFWEKFGSVGLENQEKFLNQYLYYSTTTLFQGLTQSNTWELSQFSSGQKLLDFQNVLSNPSLPLTVDQYRILSPLKNYLTPVMKSRTDLIIDQPENFTLKELSELDPAVVIALAEKKSSLLSHEWEGETLLHLAWNHWVVAFENNPQDFFEGLPQFQTLIEMGADPYQKTSTGDLLDVLALDYRHLNKEYIGSQLAAECARIDWLPLNDIAQRYHSEMPDLMCSVIEAHQELNMSVSRSAAKLWKSIGEDLDKSKLMMVVYALPDRDSEIGKYGRKVLAQLSIKLGVDPQEVLDSAPIKKDEALYNGDLEEDSWDDKDDHDLLNENKDEIYFQEQYLVNKSRLRI